MGGTWVWIFVRPGVAGHASCDQQRLPDFMIEMVVGDRRPIFLGEQHMHAAAGLTARQAQVPSLAVNGACQPSAKGGAPGWPDRHRSIAGGRVRRSELLPAIQSLDDSHEGWLETSRSEDIRALETKYFRWPQTAEEAQHDHRECLAPILIRLALRRV